MDPARKNNKLCMVGEENLCHGLCQLSIRVTKSYVCFVLIARSESRNGFLVSL